MQLKKLKIPNNTYEKVENPGQKNWKIKIFQIVKLKNFRISNNELETHKNPKQ